jgi:prepilin-type N-terminal cleavage/methylation domain-containing protein
VTIRSPKYNSQGFTLVEILASLIIVGIILGLAMPSFLSLNKPLRNGSLQFKSQLSLIRSKAISSSQAYRIRPKFPNRADYVNSIPNQFIVEYATNCQVTTFGTNIGWDRASQLDVDLPASVGITNEPSNTIVTSSGSNTIDNSLNWNICFDNRGVVYSSTAVPIKNIIIKDFQSTSKANIAVFLIAPVGGVDLLTYTNNSSNNYPVGSDLNDGQLPIPNPSF